MQTYEDTAVGLDLGGKSIRGIWTMLEQAALSTAMATLRQPHRTKAMARLNAVLGRSDDCGAAHLGRYGLSDPR